MDLPTVKLRNGQTVLAKLYKEELQAVTYANRTQAYNKEAQLKAIGVECYVWQGTGRPFYIVIEQPQEPK